eukprot:GHVR01143577.1.p1 GENE.GHVR01143577.1~~GHVR01143577.1.p1  ORF type:complete len:318 (+),score=75.92 GHVR01143577.1:159-1112(+)
MFRKSLGLCAKLTFGTSAIGVYDYYFPSTFQHFGFIRFGRAALSASVIGCDYILTDFNNWDICHTRAAQRLLNIALVNKGVYIKIGQFMSSLDYLLPEEYIQKMKILHSDAPFSLVEDVKDVIKHELNIFDISEIFSSFDPNPLGCASLAQVHKATLRGSTTTVAVKVQHKEVLTSAPGDINAVKTISYVARLLFPKAKFEWLGELLETHIPVEMDFIQEAKNSIKAKEVVGRIDTRRKQLDPGVCLSPSAPPCVQQVEFHVPEVHTHVSTSRVLTMEFCPGCRIDDTHTLTRQRVNTARKSLNFYTPHSLTLLSFF